MTNRDRLPFVHGEIAFARRSPQEDAPAVSLPNIEVPSVSYDIPIRNARPIARALLLQREGFMLVEQPCSCSLTKDPVEVRLRFLDEMVPFIKEYFKASWVVPSLSGSYMRRAEGTAGPKEFERSMTLRQVAGMAHFDYSAVAGPMIAAAANQDQKIPIRPYSRLLLVQAWRVVSAPPQDFPLAFCDASTLDASDVIEFEYMSNLEGRPGSVFKTVMICWNPAQSWYFFPDMTPDEMILFTGYDLQSHYAPRAAHSSFDDRRATPHALQRESIEGRFFVYYA